MRLDFCNILLKVTNKEEGYSRFDFYIPVKRNVLYNIENDKFITIKEFNKTEYIELDNLNKISVCNGTTIADYHLNAYNRLKYFENISLREIKKFQTEINMILFNLEQNLKNKKSR